jgi:hypothetical protein
MWKEIAVASASCKATLHTLPGYPKEMHEILIRETENEIRGPPTYYEANMVSPHI